MALCGECHREVHPGALFCYSCGAAVRPASTPHDLVGATVAGKYFVQQLLGRGGMGVVYKAVHLGLDRPVVVKVLERALLADPSIAQRFHREARAASRLNHPNSISVIDFGRTEDGALYMAMELVAGRTLAQVIVEEWPLGEARVVDIGTQILAALGEAHAQGVIHRDLKPANVMLERRRDGGDHVKVLDFGIAQLAGGAEADTRLTQHGTVYGTPAYMSPEQARGEELDPRSDLYSVGVILYELLAGVLPFDAATPIGLLAKAAEQPVPALSERRPGLAVCPSLEAVVTWALQKDRLARPASADELRAALLASRLSEGRFPPGRPSPVLAPTAPLRALHPAPPARDVAPVEVGSRATSLALTVAIALAAGVVAAAWALGGSRNPPEARARPTDALPGPATRAQTASVAAPGVAIAPPPLAAVAPGPPDTAPESSARTAGEEQAAAAPPAPRAAARRPARREPRPAEAARAPAIRTVSGELGGIPTPLASSGDGLLVLEASPWAEVSLDGAPLGETPREVRVAAGTYTVRAVHPDLGAREARVRVAAGERRLWAASFGP